MDKYTNGASLIAVGAVGVSSINLINSFKYQKKTDGKINKLEESVKKIVSILDKNGNRSGDGNDALKEVKKIKMLVNSMQDNINYLNSTISLISKKVGIQLPKANITNPIYYSSEEEEDKEEDEEEDKEEELTRQVMSMV